ncbi:MAG: response regulator receiver protein [Porticoccaceae bacterium]|jgi:antitoxin CptB|nr:response regulator receiver protein [Porticoccaceae bacterium]|tara:strand:+ start:197 stop:436 length:240 start_codon:yes stop_codon:yes gene_type:complete
MHKNRLNWAARRGMLELDLLLQPFVENEYEKLNQEDKLRFEVLLEKDDQTLLRWFLKLAEPSDLNIKRIVDLIRATFSS